MDRLGPRGMDNMSGRVNIRAANAHDAAAIAKVQVDSWRSTYAGLLPDKVLLDLDDRAHEARWWRQALTRPRLDHVARVAEHQRGGVIGFGSGGPTRDPALPYRGEIYALYLDDRFHGQGLGRRLFGALSGALAARFGPSLIVWVLDGNPARYFYEVMGGRRVAERADTFRGAPIRELGYGWEDTEATIASFRPPRA